ncbi:MAG: putative metal-binding motif-containing protein [Candidatus Woesearchaeota archaeon]
MKKLALLSAILVLFASSVYAESAAYVVRSTSYPDQNVVEALQSDGFTVTLIDDHDAATTNFGAYDLLVVGNEVFVNLSAIPVKQHRSLVMNTYYVNNWGFASGTGTFVVGNGFLKGKIVTVNSVTQGIASPVQLYDAYNIVAYDLPMLPDRSRDLTILVATNNLNANAFIGTLSPGDRLYGGGYATQRSCFFGLTATNYWTPEARTLFIRCARFALAGLDRDSDGFGQEVDCNDTNANIHPGAAEIPYNHIDENCDGFDLADSDADSFCKLGYVIQNKALQCPLEPGSAGTDCNDNDANIHPSAQEIPYDSIDQNCDGKDTADVDADGYCKLGYTIMNRTLQCNLETGSTGTDCDDNSNNVHPGTTEILLNGIDENCDGLDYTIVDSDNDSYCLAGYIIQNKTFECALEPSALGTDCNDLNASIHFGVSDIPFNHVDENCDGYDLADLDLDGYCKAGYAIQDKNLQCPHETGSLGTDCNDNTANINPGKTDIPYNGLDENCDGFDLADLDADGYCKLGYLIQNKTLQCPLESGNTGTDCNDNDATTHPNAQEIPYDSIDQNCDGTDIADLDSDGYCKLGYTIQNKSIQCALEPGTLGTDCNDNNSNVNPGKKEIYHNGIDDDCNPATDDNDWTPPLASLQLKATFSGGKILLTWTSPPGEKVEIYNIYEAESPETFNFSMPVATTRFLNWTDNSASSAQKRFYVVRSEDAAANIETNDYKVGKFDIILSQGYNLVSSPLAFFNNTISQVLQGQAVTEIIRYSHGFETASLHSGSGFTSLDLNEGYFFKVDSALTFTFTGSVTSPTHAVSLEPGINLVGYGGFSPSGFSVFDSSSVVEVSQFVNHKYETSTYYPQHGWFSAEGFSDLKPGRGYFVKAATQSVWSYTSQ